MNEHWKLTKTLPFAMFVMACVVATAPPAHAIETCLGRTATMTGTAGDDIIVGSPGDDVIAALGGHDVIQGASATM